MEYPSEKLKKAVEVFASLPGIGHKTALRLALHLLAKDTGATVGKFTHALQELKEKTQSCEHCGNITDQSAVDQPAVDRSALDQPAKICKICANPDRDRSIICVVKDIRDVMAIEQCGKYKGLYHVLGGLLEPMDGIGPENLNIESLKKRLETAGVQELILALDPTLPGNTTAFYLYKKLKDIALGLHVSSIPCGIPLGAEIEYSDPVTLAQSIANRVPYSSTFKAG